MFQSRNSSANTATPESVSNNSDRSRSRSMFSLFSSGITPMKKKHSVVVLRFYGGGLLSRGDHFPENNQLLMRSFTSSGEKYLGKTIADGCDPKYVPTGGSGK